MNCRTAFMCYFLMVFLIISIEKGELEDEICVTEYGFNFM